MVTLNFVQIQGGRKGGRRAEDSPSCPPGQQWVQQDKPHGGAGGDNSPTGDGANKHLAIKLYYIVCLAIHFSELGIILTLPAFQILCTKGPCQVLCRRSAAEDFLWLALRLSHRQESPTQSKVPSERFIARTHTYTKTSKEWPHKQESLWEQDAGASLSILQSPIPLEPQQTRLQAHTGSKGSFNVGKPHF